VPPGLHVLRHVGTSSESLLPAPEAQLISRSLVFMRPSFIRGITASSTTLLQPFPLLSCSPVQFLFCLRFFSNRTQGSFASMKGIGFSPGGRFQIVLPPLSLLFFGPKSLVDDWLPVSVNRVYLFPCENLHSLAATDNCRTSALS